MGGRCAKIAAPEHGAGTNGAVRDSERSMTIGILRLSEGEMAAGWVGVYYKYAYKKQNDVFHRYIHAFVRSIFIRMKGRLPH